MIVENVIVWFAVFLFIAAAIALCALLWEVFCSLVEVAYATRPSYNCLQNADKGLELSIRVLNKEERKLRKLIAEYEARLSNCERVNQYLVAAQYETKKRSK